VPAHRGSGRSLTGRRGRYPAPLPRTRTSTDPAHRSPLTPGVPRPASRASARVWPGGWRGRSRRAVPNDPWTQRRPSHTRCRTTPLPPRRPVDHDDPQPPIPDEEHLQGHHVEAVALVDCRQVRFGRKPPKATASPMGRPTQRWTIAGATSESIDELGDHLSPALLGLRLARR
jgi:hypothetical protein